MIKTVLLLIFRLVLRITFGLYKTPKLQPPCIVISNHNTHFDVYVLTMLFPLRALPCLRSAAAADTFKSGFLGGFCRTTLNPILVDRHAHAHDPLAKMKAAVERGDSLIIFPEGTRGEPGVIAPFKPGIGEIARSFPQVPIYPCFIAGIERVWPRSTRLPLPFNVEIMVGKPYHADPMMHRREIAQQLEAEVHTLADRYEHARRGETVFPD